jgi:apolipoprotein N-acyltransferase
MIVILVIILLSSTISFSASEKKEVKVAVLHPSSHTYQKLESNTKSQYEFLKHTLERENFQGADLLVCGESYLEDMNRFPLIVNELDSHPAIKALNQLSVQYQTPILSGAILVEMKYGKKPPTFTAKKKTDEEYFDIYNGSVLIRPSEPTAWRSKQKFVPITETYPFLSLFEFLFDNNIINFQGQSSYGSSVNNAPYLVGELTVSPQICFENLFPTALKKRGVQQADLQILMSNDWSQSASIIQKQSSYAQASVNSFGVPLVFASYNENAVYHGFDEASNLKRRDLSFFNVNLQTKNTIYPAIMPFYHLFFTFSSILFLILSYINVNKTNE